MACSIKRESARNSMDFSEVHIWGVFRQFFVVFHPPHFRYVGGQCFGRVADVGHLRQWGRPGGRAGICGNGAWARGRCEF